MRTGRGWLSGGVRAAWIAALACVLAGLVPAAASAADPGRWAETGRSTIRINYFQGITSDQSGDLFFDGIATGLYRTSSQLSEELAKDNVIPASVLAEEGYNHVGDLTWDAGEGGRILLPLECYYPGINDNDPGTSDDANTCKTGSIGVANPATLTMDYYVKLDDALIKKAMWAEVSPDGGELWTQGAGNRLLAYDMADIAMANAAPAGDPIEPVKNFAGAIPPGGGITGATFFRGRLYVANQTNVVGQTTDLHRVRSIDLSSEATAQDERLEIERELVGESEGLDVFGSLGGILHWQIQPFDLPNVPTYDPANGSLLHFVPVARDVADRDDDGGSDDEDTCPTVPNAPPQQGDTDGDSLGDLCDPDDDNDGVADAAQFPAVPDNCRTAANAGQLDTDGDGDGDACDTDDDNDGLPEATDSCPIEAGGGTANGCPPSPGADSDNDGVLDADDNCAATANGDQADNDGTGGGDRCDLNDDGDNIDDAGGVPDNCRTMDNQDQANGDADLDGNACDPDDDNDGLADADDNCAVTANASQGDADQDGQGNACDPDEDGDGVANGADNCAGRTNPDQANADGDARGNACEDDDDNDGLADFRDRCPLVAAATADGCPAADNPANPADTTAPETTLIRAKVKQRKRRATISFVSSEPGSTFECRLDRKRVRSCSSPQRLKRLKPGRHRFSVAARDAAGNVDPTPAVKKLRIKR